MARDLMALEAAALLAGFAFLATSHHLVRASHPPAGPGAGDR